MFTLKAYQCGFCIQNLKAPITLPCGHNVCRDCWSSLQNKCPSCSHVYPEGAKFEVNAALDKAIQELLSLSTSNLVEDESLHINYDELKILDELGEGAFGRVYKCVWRDTECALKMLLCSDLSSDALADFEKEVFIMKKLRHPNIVLFMGACTLPKKCLITEFMAGGSLWDELRRRGRPERLKGLRISLNIARGMRALHSIKIIHRDLKSKNVLLDDHGTAKIADFGLSKIKTETIKLTCGLGTPQWMSPESLQTAVSGMPSDVYSFGVVMYEIITGLIPFDGYMAIQVGMQVVAGNRPSFPDDVTRDDEWVKLIERCWAQEPEGRPTFSDCIVELERLIQLTGGRRSLSFNNDLSESSPQSVQGFSTFLNGLGIHQPDKIVAPGVFFNVADDDDDPTPPPAQKVVEPGVFFGVSSSDGQPQQSMQPVAPAGLFSDLKLVARPLPPRPHEIEQQKARLLTSPPDTTTTPSSLDKLLLVAQQRSGSDASVALAHTDSSSYDSDESFVTSSSSGSTLRTAAPAIFLPPTRTARCVNCKSSFDFRNPLGCTKGEPGEGAHMARCTRCKKGYDVRRPESCWFHKTSNSLKGLVSQKCTHCKRSLNEIGCQRAENHEPRT